jgi:O-methyltransferase involved in polyketide biosynthesis
MKMTFIGGLVGRRAVELGPVQETLLIPLLGRAAETRRAGGLLRDPKAVEIVEQLDYDFSKWEGIRSLVGASLRTRMFDEEVRAFLAEHPGGTVVELGCGLNTRYERLDNGTARWFELDLPDSMALRRQFFEDTPRRTMLAASVLQTDWMEIVAATGGPWCFVSEAVLIYLDEPEVRQVVSRLAARFPGAWLLVDTTSAAMVDNQDKHDAMSKLPSASHFRWKCDDPRALERWAPMGLIRSRTLLEAPAEMRRALPWSLWLPFTFAPWLVRRRLDGYRMNRYILGS